MSDVKCRKTGQNHHHKKKNTTINYPTTHRKTTMINFTRIKTTKSPVAA